MNREIKFRAWDKNLNKYFYDIQFSQYIDEFDGYMNFCDWLKSPKDWIVEQYVGRNDKNGKEIYEGDIVKYQIQVGKLGSDIGKVKWYNILSAFKILNKCGKGTAYIEQVEEVKGNIYEDSELMKNDNKKTN